jgi:hypothetical protein
MNNDRQFIGIVKSNRLHILTPRLGSEEPASLTPESMVVKHEIKPMDLSAYDGKAIAVRGYGGSGWIYSAKIIDQAGPIVTALLAKVFGQEDLLA